MVEDPKARMGANFLAYPFRIESFFSVGTACSRDRSWNRDCKSLPRICPFHEGSLKWDFSTYNEYNHRSDATGNRSSSEV